MVRAAQKDAMYLHQLSEGLQDSAHAALPPATALRLSPELRLLSRLLYMCATCGAGLQTLGEEYCDILRVNRHGAPPTVLQTAMYIACQSLGSYAVERLPLAAAPPPTDGTAGPPPWQRAHAWLVSNRTRLLQALQAGHRLHLALFYLNGEYYRAAARAAGLRFAYVGRDLAPSARYGVLGVLLLAQILGGGLYAAHRHLTPPKSSLPAGTCDGARGASEPEELGEAELQPEQCVYLLDETGARVGEDEASEDCVSAALTSQGQCPLCLGTRQQPTSARCGHVFCWDCIAHWGQRKAECPLCRTPFTPQHLVPVYGL